jgi:hypothetical protein
MVCESFMELSINKNTRYLAQERILIIFPHQTPPAPREGCRRFTGIRAANHHYEYLSDRYDCEFVTLLCSTAGNESYPAILALDPHPQLRGRVLPRLAAMAHELCRTHSLSSPRAEGILLCSAAYVEYDKLRRITRIPLYCKLQTRNEDVSLLVLNLFRLTIP